MSTSSVFLRRTLGAFVLLAAASASAQTVVTDAWVRATVPAQKTGGAYLTLRSPDTARVLKGASTAAESVELHTMQMKGTMMSMREVPAIELPAGKPVSEFHVMLMGLKRPLKEGDKIPLALTVERAGGKVETVNVDVEVKPLGYQPKAMQHAK